MGLVYSVERTELKHSILNKRKVVVEKKRKQDALKAINTINDAFKDKKKAAMKNISDLEEVLSARQE